MARTKQSIARRSLAKAISRFGSSNNNRPYVSPYAGAPVTRAKEVKPPRLYVFAVHTTGKTGGITNLTEENTENDATMNGFAEHPNGSIANGGSNGVDTSMQGSVNGTNGHASPDEAQVVAPVAAQVVDVDLEAGPGEAMIPMSWHAPHPMFVILLIGPDEIPFGIQKDLLCSQSPHFRAEFSQPGQEDSVEMVVRLPETEVEVFGCFQCFIFTGKVYDKENGRAIPEYTQLLGVWKLAAQFKMASLRLAVLDVMAERREQTNRIPGTSLLISAWKETQEGSGLRRMLIGWAAEHMRASPEFRRDFAKNLPQEILFELACTMADMPAPNAFDYAPPPQQHAPQVYNNSNNGVIGNELLMQAPTYPRPAAKRARKSDVGFLGDANDEFESKPVLKKHARRSEPTGRKNNRRQSAPAPIPLSADNEMNYCAQLIQRMCSGPGYWTRLVGPFKNPVDPVVDQVPNYFDVIKKPMDLSTIRAKMTRGEYANASEFENDVRLIFQNAYEYWTENDKTFRDCLAFEKYFNEQWGNRHTWKAPTIKAEIID